MTQKLNIVSGVIQLEGKFLLCHRINTEYYPNHWSFPVGKVEANENNLDALRRELFEEINIQMIDAQALMTLFDQNNNIEHHVFLVTEWKGKIKRKEPELCSAVNWFDLCELPEAITPSTQTILNSFELQDQKL